MPLTEEEAASLAKLPPDLRFVFCARELPDVLQVQLFNVGFRTLGLLSSMVDTKAELRESLKTSFDLDPAEIGITPAEILSRRVNMAQFVDCWDTATKRQEETTAHQSEQRAGKLPITILKSVHVALRVRYETEFRRVQDRSWPCHALVEIRLE